MASRGHCKPLLRLPIGQRLHAKRDKLRRGWGCRHSSSCLLVQQGCHSCQSQFLCSVTEHMSKGKGGPLGGRALNLCLERQTLFGPWRIPCLKEKILVEIHCYHGGVYEQTQGSFVLKSVQFWKINCLITLTLRLTSVLYILSCLLSYLSIWLSITGSMQKTWV